MSWSFVAELMSTSADLEEEAAGEGLGDAEGFPAVAPGFAVVVADLEVWAVRTAAVEKERAAARTAVKARLSFFKGKLLSG